MDIRTLTKLILKLAGAYLLVTVLFSLPSVAATPSDYLASAIIYLVGYVVVGLSLLWFPGAITNHVFRIAPSELEGHATEESLLRVGVRLLGGYFALSSAYGLVFSWAKVRLFFLGTHPPALAPEDSAAILAWAIQLAAGLAFWFAGGSIVRLSGAIENGR